MRAILEKEIKALQKNPPCPLPPIFLRRGAGAYICGEESAMIESIEGKRGMPRLRPPYVAQVGLFGYPTLEHNMETLYWVREIIEKGAEWFAGHGRNGRKGLRSFSVSGRVVKPGVHLAPAGITVKELIAEYCGGMLPGHNFYAYRAEGIKDWTKYMPYIEQIINENFTDNIHILTYKSQVSPDKPEPAVLSIRYIVDDTTHTIKFKILEKLNATKVIFNFLKTQEEFDIIKVSLLILKTKIHRPTSISITFFDNENEIYNRKVKVRTDGCIRKDFTEETKKAVLEKSNNCCAITEIKFNEMNRYQFDHINGWYQCVFLHATEILLMYKLS